MLITRIIDDILCLHKALIFPPHSLHSGYSHLYVHIFYLSRPTCVCTIKATKWVVVSSTMDYTLGFMVTIKLIFIGQLNKKIYYVD